MRRLLRNGRVGAWYVDLWHWFVPVPGPEVRPSRFSGSLAGTFSRGGSFSGRLSSTPLGGRPSIATLARPINAVSVCGFNTASIYSGISASNPFAAYYANPLAAGVPGSLGTTSATFGASDHTTITVILVS
jgi:hypothetical protein